MHVAYNSQQSIKKETVHKLVLLTVLISSVLFFVDTVAAQVAAPGYRLMGTVEGKTFTGAVLADSTGVQTFYSLHEKLPDGSQLVEVRSDGITLKSADGIFYDMYISHDTKTVASVRPGVQSAPSVPAAISNSHSEQPTPRGHSRIRHESEAE